MFKALVLIVLIIVGAKILCDAGTHNMNVHKLRTAEALQGI